MIKKAYSIQMSYNVSDDEKNQAQKALIFFNHTDKLLDLASEHLNIMKVPFKDNPEMLPADVLKARAAIRRFRDKSLENFNEFKREAFKCVNIMKEFSSDTQTLKLMKSFISSIDKLEIKVNDFSDLFENLESKDFSKEVVVSIETVQAECESINEIIEERIKNHIQTNILATNWVNSISTDLQMQVQEKTPLILDLFNERQNQLNNIIKEKNV